MFQRIHLQEIRSRILAPRKFIQVILGPRQVGKTTMITQLVEQIKIPYHFVSADGVLAANSTWLSQQWNAAEVIMESNQYSEFLLVIDEIQKIDNWSEVVKLHWDAGTRKKKDIKVIILGSSRLLLQQGLTESLAGRFESTYMGHWSFDEMQKAFGWNANQYAWFGGYPGSADLISDEKRWKNYIQQSLVETSISKDILMLSRVDKPALMRRLFEMGCFYSGQIISYTKILGQLQDRGNTTTISHYLELLDTAGLLRGIEKYTRSLIRTRSSSPKFQVHNTALMSSAMDDSFEDVVSNPKEWGRIVEASVGSHLLNSSIKEGFTLHYWRERQEEVDFVIEKKGKLVAIEVKSGSDQSEKGLKSFEQQFSPIKILLVGDRGIPWQKFLTMNPDSLF